MRDGKVFRFDAETRTIVDEGEWRYEGNIRTVTITAGECQGATIRYETTQVLGINEIWHVVVSNTCDSAWGTPSGRALQHGRSPLKDWQRELLVARGYNADFL